MGVYKGIIVCWLIIYFSILKFFITLTGNSMVTQIFKSEPDFSGSMNYYHEIFLKILNYRKLNFDKFD